MVDKSTLPKFPSPFDTAISEPRTLVEYRMRVLSGRIREKPSWWQKLRDPDIAARWRAEMRAQDQQVVDELWGGQERFYVCHLEPKQEYETEEQFEQRRFPENGGRWGKVKQWPRDPISDAQLDYLFDELSHAANTGVDEVTGIYPSSVHGVHESRTLILADLRAALVKGVAALEDIPEDEKDWHPGSNKQVLDLVHPSLYPLRIGRSFVVRQAASPGSNTVEQITWETYSKQRPDLSEYQYREYVVSRAYQWLPTNFKISTGEDHATLSATPLGYINNLNPTQHGELYPVISASLARFVPLWERVLSDLLSPEPPLAVQPNTGEWYDDLPPEPDYDDDSMDIDQYYREVRWPVVPEPGPYSPPSTEDRTTITLSGRTLQVIVKLANIVLTPENPIYPGGSWHVEGMANEKIVATGLYYYAMENITESRLEFRTVVGNEDSVMDLPYEQGDSKGYAAVYGFGANDELNQVVGSILAEQGKCVAFPNTYQHHVNKFELADKTKPGYRKILCFFLVDPYTRVLSTSDVLPQQEDWAMEEIVKTEGLQRLPRELYDIITGHVRAGTMTREEANEDREKLMEERKAFVVEHNEQVYEVKFNMCEH